MNKIVSFISTDGLQLYGIYYSFGFRKSVIHVHGLAGNFYSSTYHDQLIRTYKKLGYNYLSFNNRGSEYIKQLKNLQTSKSDFYGYTYEVFDESDCDILGAIQFLKDQNIEKIILQGHSSGCQKIIYTVNKHRLVLDHVVLLSPCDDVGLALKHYSKNIFEGKIAYAKNSPTKLLPSNFFFDLPISTVTFLNYFGKSNNFDIFHYYQPEVSFDELELNHNNTLVIFGEHDHVLDFNVVKDVYNKLHNYTVSIISNSNHKYNQKEDCLAKIIYNYVNQS